MVRIAKNRVDACASEFVKVFYKLMGGKYQPWQVWSDFVFVTAAAISNTVDKENFDKREQQYFEIIKRYDPNELPMFAQLIAETVKALEANAQQDFLGAIYMQLELGNHWKGQFFTPYCLCQLMADINGENLLDQVQQNGYITVSDPACGAGATLIAFAHTMAQEIYKSKCNLNWQNHVLFAAQDIDAVAGLMCYIQLSMLGCAGYIKIGNTLLHPMATGDSKEDYWFTPMYYSEVWHLRRLFHSMDSLIGAVPAKPIDAAVPAVVVPEIKETFDFEFTEEKNGQLSIF